MTARRLVIVALLAATAALALAARPRPERPTPADAPTTWVAIDPPRPLRDWRVADEAGAPWPAAALVGGWTVVEIGYTSCPDVCPTGLTRLAEVLDLDRGLRGLFLAVDPDRDRAHLRAYVGYFHPRLRGATGDRAAVDQAVDELGASYELMPDGAVDHSTAYFVVDPHANVVAAIPPPATAAELATALAEVRADRAPALDATLWSPRRPPGTPGVAYGRLHNRGRTPLVVSVVGAELHRTVVHDGVARMEPVPALTVAPGATVTLAPGGLHLMLPARDAAPVLELRTADGVGHLIALGDQDAVVAR